jgi:hypothetical protein
MTLVNQNTAQQSFKHPKNRQKITETQNQQKSCQSKEQPTNKIYTYMSTEKRIKVGLATR